MARPLSVLVVDDSAVVRRLLADAFGREPDIHVVGTASDPFAARELILKYRPDVMTLDVEMPRMDGISFLRRVMAFRPMPVVIVSSVTPQGSAASVEALRLGAIDVIPKTAGPGSVGAIAERIVRLLRELQMGPRVRLRRLATAPVAPLVASSATRRGNGLILIGASTGGTQAIESVLARLPADTPPVLIVQHMPPLFTRAFAARIRWQAVSDPALELETHHPGFDSAEDAALFANGIDARSAAGLALEGGVLRLRLTDGASEVIDAAWVTV